MPDLDALIEQLTSVHDAEISDHGRPRLRRQPPLLADLARARTASIGPGNGRKAPHERLVLNADASELYTEIERTARTWALRAGYRRPPTGWPPLEQLLAAWWDYARTATTVDRDDCAATLAAWVEQITDLIDPPYRYALTAPCPACGATWIDTGDDRGYALHVTEREPADRSVVTCRNPACGASWHGLDGAEALSTLIRKEQTA